MSDKKLADVALSDVEVENDEVVVSFASAFSCPIARSSRLFGFPDFYTSVRADTVRIDYPPNMTDQIHGLSIAQMVNSDSAHSGVIPEDAYDLKVGEHLSDSVEVHSMYETDWASPEQIYESEQALAKTIQSEDALYKAQAKRRDSDDSAVNSDSSVFADSSESAVES